MQEDKILTDAISEFNQEEEEKTIEALKKKVKHILSAITTNNTEIVDLTERNEALKKKLAEFKFILPKELKF